jgi:hypothetical protein
MKGWRPPSSSPSSRHGSLSRSREQRRWRGARCGSRVADPWGECPCRCRCTALRRHSITRAGRIANRPLRATRKAAPRCRSAPVSGPHQTQPRVAVAAALGIIPPRCLPSIYQRTIRSRRAAAGNLPRGLSARGICRFLSLWIAIHVEGAAGNSQLELTAGTHSRDSAVGECSPRGCHPIVAMCRSRLHPR